MEKAHGKRTRHKEDKKDQQVSTDQYYRWMLLTILNDFGYLNRPLVEAESMTLNEFFLRYEAYALKREEENQRIAMQAWSNQQVKATKGESDSIKPYYRTLRDFYDSTKEINRIRSTFEPDFVPERADGHRRKTKSDIVYERALALMKQQNENHES